jgi:hypothetical protein
LNLEPCCLLVSKLHIDPEDLYQKHFSVEKPQLPPHTPYIIEEKPIQEKENEKGAVALGEKEKEAGVKEVSAPTKAPKTGWKRYIGLFLALMATSSYSLGTLIIKVLHTDHPFTVSFWRYKNEFNF